MKPSTLNETLGLFTGYLFGISFAALALIRRSRPFHPQGYLYEGDVESKILPSKVLIRFSSAWWKKNVLPDVLGVSLRFSHDSNWDVKDQRQYQDILMVNVAHLLQLFIAPLIADYKDFLHNKYFSITSFSVMDNPTPLRLLCESTSNENFKREIKLKKAVEIGEVVLILQIKDSHQWTEIAKIKLRKQLNLDQRKFKFSPFNQAFGIKPIGFVNFLRLGGYRLSQSARELIGQ